MTLELDRLERTYGDFTLGPLSLTVEPGVTAVLGPSGSGKSTLLSLVAGFESPDSGRVFVDGRRIDTRPPEERSVGMVFQNYALFPHLSVRENLAFGASEDGSIESTAELLEIDHLLDRDPGTLSGGEAQRVGLARALVSEPSVLLLDEPLSSLDAPIRRRLRLELRDVLSDLEIPVVYVTHDQAEAAIVGDRLALLKDGDLVREGATEAVFERPEHAFVAEFLGMENCYPATVVETNGNGTVLELGDTTLRAAGEPPSPPITVAIHPEAIDLEPAGSDPGEDQNAIPCSVSRIRTRQTGATVVLEGQGFGRLTASVGKGVAAGFEVGDAVQASVAPADVHLTRRDR
ncbi:MAG: ABC transporter ATP-binding protein [Halodesulfurarchaeum sp.]|nr:ABC transporter ATP-binding protein [Halodesulfurarchaeum sp.]